MQLFYCKDIAEGVLDAEESRHAVRVLRLKAGDEIEVTDGTGTRAVGRIAAADERGCAFEVVRLGVAEAMPVGMSLAVAPTKNPSRMEWLVEKAVEVGVSQIYLLQGERSERVFMKTDRLQRIAVSAMKQSLRCVLPRIHPVMTVSEFLTGTASMEGAQLLIAHCDAATPRVPLAEAMQAGRDTTVLIGPEGDFSAAEVALAVERGYRPVSFGRYRLRTETAALFAVGAFNFINGIKAE